jgi:hypothetical protein
MVNKISAALCGLLGLGLAILSTSSPVSAITEPRMPSVGWLEGRPAPKGVPASAEPAKLEPIAPALPQPVAKPSTPAEPEPMAEPEAAAKRAPERIAKPVAPVEVAKPIAVPVASPAPKREPVVIPAPVPVPKPAVAEKPVAQKPAAKPAPEPASASEPEESGTLSVNSTPEGAEVYLDGANLGQTPIEIDIPTGPHKLKVVQPGTFSEKRLPVTVRAGKTSEIKVTF